MEIVGFSRTWLSCPMSVTDVGSNEEANSKGDMSLIWQICSKQPCRACTPLETTVLLTYVPGILGLGLDWTWADWGVDCACADPCQFQYLFLNMNLFFSQSATFIVWICEHVNYICFKVRWNCNELRLLSSWILLVSLPGPGAFLLRALCRMLWSLDSQDGAAPLSPMLRFRPCWSRWRIHWTAGAAAVCRRCPEGSLGNQLAAFATHCRAFSKSSFSAVLFLVLLATFGEEWVIKNNDNMLIYYITILWYYI